MANLLDHPPLPTEPKGDRTEVARAETPEKSAEPLGWGRLAARIAQWTTRGLLCAIIAAASVGFGRQVLRWWYEETPESGKAAFLTDPLAGLGEEERVHVFRFGDAPWEFRRQVILGDARRAFDRLKTECAQATAACQTSGPEPSAQQRQFLERLKDRAPVAKGTGWAVYAFYESVPLVVGVRERDHFSTPPSEEKNQPARKEEKNPSFPASSALTPNIPLPTKTENPKGKTGEKAPPLPSPSESEVAQQPLNVVSWGFGIPSGEGRWTLYTLVAVSSVGGGPQGVGEGIPIPPESTLMYSLGLIQGPALTLFRGPPRPETWKSFYETYFRTHGGRQLGVWQQQGVRWRSRFLWPGASEPEAAQAGSSREKIVEISFGPDAADTWTGLIWIWAEGPSAATPATGP
ncbi:MAG TPA: hypothetical protein PLQ00_07730 [Thermoguttaceae bacterium]|nr:hypothetical protein [Thermoguttaceae bacterium]